MLREVLSERLECAVKGPLSRRAADSGDSKEVAKFYKPSVKTGLYTLACTLPDYILCKQNDVILSIAVFRQAVRY